MNQFHSLDSLFPVTPNRLSGEVVTTAISFIKGQQPFDYVNRLNLSWKRKAWYVNASVNAFHMHRGLCREFVAQKASIYDLSLTSRELATVKKLIAKAVMNSYLVNYESGDQGCQYSIVFCDTPSRTISLWWDVGYTQTDWREICL